MVYTINASILFWGLHPFTDFNGISARAIWAWIMKRDYDNFGDRFLKEWYKESLEYISILRVTNQYLR